MISTVKREIAISKELHSKIEWACTFSNCEPKIKNGNLRMVEKTNIAYVDPHKVIINDIKFLFFNGVDCFYINSLNDKHEFSELETMFKKAKLLDF